MNIFNQILVSYLEGGNLSVKNVQILLLSRVQGPVVSVRIASDIFRHWASLSDRSRSHETDVTALSITVRKLHPSIELSSLFPSVKFKAIAGMLGLWLSA